MRPVSSGYACAAFTSESSLKGVSAIPPVLLKGLRLHKDTTLTFLICNLSVPRLPKATVTAMS